jgi:serine/threonine protein kinase
LRLKGSPAFASPEQCETKKLDIRSDNYSLGVTQGYLLSGKRPFSGSVGEVTIAQVIKPPPFDQLAHLPEPLLQLLRRMLAKNPDHRFQTPQELQDAQTYRSKCFTQMFFEFSTAKPTQRENLVSCIFCNVPTPSAGLTRLEPGIAPAFDRIF